MRLSRVLLAPILAVGMVLTAGSAAVAVPAASHAHAAHPPVRLIIDTDFGQWWDDVAALAMVHAAASTGRVRILAVMSDVDNRWDAAGIDALNTWYGRPGIPIGIPARATTAGQNYSQMLARHYPHAGHPTGALTLYRRLLRAQPDHSVTILSIGALTNLAQLARANAALVARKVAHTVIMGGAYPRATEPEWNFNLDLAATRQVVADWPAPTAYDGFEIGTQVFAGNHVCATHPAGSPVRAVFNLLYSCGNNQTDGTWDPTAMYYALYGTDHVYALAGAGGHNTVTPDGLNAWTPGGHHQRYLVLTDTARLTHAIDTLIDTTPTANNRGSVKLS